MDVMVRGRNGGRTPAAGAVRGFTLLLFGLALVASLVIAAAQEAGAAGGPAGPSNVVGPAGPVRVTVLPTVGLQNGQTIAIHAKAPSGAVLYEVRAHLCVHGANVTNTWDFSYEGKVCTRAGVGAGDFEQAVGFDGGASTGDLAFKAGTGSTTWTDDRSFTHTITCGQGALCDLVVQIQATNATAYYTAPLCYGTGCGAEPAVTGVAKPPAATTTTTSAKPHGAQGPVAPPATIITPFGVSIPAPTTTTTSDPSSRRAQALVAAHGSGDDGGPSEMHLVLAGFIGAVGGARLFQLSGRIRKGTKAGS